MSKAKVPAQKIAPASGRFYLVKPSPKQLVTQLANYSTSFKVFNQFHLYLGERWWNIMFCDTNRHQSFGKESCHILHAASRFQFPGIKSCVFRCIQINIFEPPANRKMGWLLLDLLFLYLNYIKNTSRVHNHVSIWSEIIYINILKQPLQDSQ